jgi:hypothetical protein
MAKRLRNISANKTEQLVFDSHSDAQFASDNTDHDFT